jgi:hypothetical protein
MLIRLVVMKAFVCTSIMFGKSFTKGRLSSQIQTMLSVFLDFKAYVLC